MNSNKWFFLLFIITLAILPTTGSAQTSFLTQDSFVPDADCPLPCWWDITPGVTTFDDANQILVDIFGFDTIYIFPETAEQQEFIAAENVLTIELLPQQETNIFIIPDIGIYKGIVDNIRVLSVNPSDERVEHWNEVWNYFAITNLIAEYGMPSQVLLFATELDAGTISNPLWLWWEDIELGIHYELDEKFAKLAGSPMCYSLENIEVIQIWLQAPDSSNPLKTSLESYITSLGLKSIDAISEFDIEEFINILIENGECLPPDLPVDWEANEMELEDRTLAIDTENVETITQALSSIPCRQPCWIGLQPDVATFDDVVATLQSKNIDFPTQRREIDSEKYAYRIGYVFSQTLAQEHEPSTIIEFIFNQELLDSININIPNLGVEADLWTEYIPSSILANYGDPTDILISGTPLTYNLWFMYEKTGLVIEYTGQITDLDRNSSTGRACFDGSHLYSANASLYGADETASLLDITAEFRATETSIDEVSELRKSEFIEYLIADPVGCIEIKVGIPTGNMPVEPVPTQTIIPPTITVTPSPVDLQAKVSECVTDRGVRNSLTVKINSRQWQALINEVEAQRGKKITEACATDLIEIATYLRDNP